MKKNYDFVYSSGQLTVTTIWYTVTVGISAVDQAAKAFIQGKAKSTTSMLFALHDKSLADFKEKVADSLFPQEVARQGMPMRMLRQRIVPVTWLAKFLRKYPAEFLNSSYLAEPKKSIDFLPRSGKSVLPTLNE